MQNHLEIEKQYLFNLYPKRNIVLVRGENTTVWDSTGTPYLDCVSGHGVSNLGHNNEYVVKAIQEQAQKMINCSPIFYNDARATLLEKLINITPASVTRAFLCNSGAESVEAAFKFTRFTSGKTDFIATTGAFHGRTFGAMSATHKTEYRAPYEPVVPGFHFVPFNDFDKFKEKVTEKTAGVILEPVQGEGGVNIANRKYLHQVRRFCRDNNIIFIVDEIQTGFCRTGRMFAVQHFDLEPDILCVAKAMAGGVPMGATVCSDKIEAPVGRHGSTFGGNPLSSAAATAAIDFMLKHDLAKKAAEKGDHFAKRISEKPLSQVREVRRLGLMIGIELRTESQGVIQACLEKGLLIFPAGRSVIRVFPPLTISFEDLDRVVDILQQVLI